jgi:hypothetical protein
VAAALCSHRKRRGSTSKSFVSRERMVVSSVPRARRGVTLPSCLADTHRLRSRRWANSRNRSHDGCGPSLAAAIINRWRSPAGHEVGISGALAAATAVTVFSTPAGTRCMSLSGDLIVCLRKTTSALLSLLLSSIGRNGRPPALAPVEALFEQGSGQDEAVTFSSSRSSVATHVPRPALYRRANDRRPAHLRSLFGGTCCGNRPFSCPRAEKGDMRCAIWQL